MKNEIQRLGKGSGRHQNRCEHCGEFVPRGLMNNVNHFHEKHQDLARKAMNFVITYTDIKNAIDAF
jgi:hypothetical protein